MDNGYVHLADGTPLPYSTRFYNANLQGIIGIDINRIGRYRIFQDRQEIDPDKIPVNLSLEVNQPCLRQYAIQDRDLHVPLRLKLLLDAFAITNGGAKSTQFGTDISPKVLVLAGQSGGNPILSNIYTQGESGPYLNIDSFITRIKSCAARGLFQTPIFVGIRQDYLLNDEDVRAIPDLVNSQISPLKVVVTTPLKAVEGIVKEFGRLNN